MSSQKLDPSQQAAPQLKEVQPRKQGQKNQRYPKRSGTQSDGFTLELNNLRSSRSNQQIGNSRKYEVSINHLLDFQGYAESEEFVSSRSFNSRQKPIKRKKQHSKVHLHGMSYINVNYKFVVDCTKEYKPQELDPNVPLPVEDIIRIIAPHGHACPICLSDDVVAPRMITSCGHILCLKCMISMLESEVPIAKKKESSVVVEKYRECPLCSSVIRKNEIKPVIISGIDERFETPKVDDEVVLTLMSRPSGKVLPLPLHLSDYHYNASLGNFPWINSDEPNFNQYSRIFKGDLNYLLSIYELEKQQILSTYEEERVLYNEPDTYVKMALNQIDSEIAQWKERMSQKDETPKTKRQPQNRDCPVFYYYQTGFNSSTTFVLSPLDAKVLKTCYGSYTNLPSSVVAKVESIRYEELTSETALSKYKYLSHLPLGSHIGFMECNWLGNPSISLETWDSFKDDLSKRTRAHQNKLRREERDKKRAIDEEETRSRNFFERENNGEPDLAEEQFTYSSFASLSIADSLGGLPIQSSSPQLAERESSAGSPTEYTTSIWGTQIPKAEEPEYSDSEDWDADEMIRRAKEEMSKLDGKKKKKKLVLW